MNGSGMQQAGGISMPGYNLSGEQPKLGMPPGIPGGSPGPVGDMQGIGMPSYQSPGNSAFGLAGGNGNPQSTGAQFMGNPAAAYMNRSDAGNSFTPPPQMPQMPGVGSDAGNRFTPMPPVNAPQGLLGPDAETLKRQLGYRIGG